MAKITGPKWTIFFDGVGAYRKRYGAIRLGYGSRCERIRLASLEVVMKHAHREYEVTICPKCGAGLVVMPQMNHVCEEKHVENDKNKDVKQEKKTSKKTSKK